MLGMKTERWEKFLPQKTFQFNGLTHVNMLDAMIQVSVLGVLGKQGVTLLDQTKLSRGMQALHSLEERRGDSHVKWKQRDLRKWKPCNRNEAARCVWNTISSSVMEEKWWGWGQREAGLKNEAMSTKESWCTLGILSFLQGECVGAWKDL